MDRFDHIGLRKLFKYLWALALLFALIQGGVSRAMINVNVLDYGAVPDDGLDDSTAFQAALNAIQAAQGGHLYIPAGGYAFNSAVTFNIVDEKRGLMIEGAGENLVYLRSSAANASGIFHITSTWRDCQITFKDFQCVAHRANAGTAISVACPYGGVQDRRIVTCENVTVRSADNNSYTTRAFPSRGCIVPFSRTAHLSAQSTPPTSATPRPASRPLTAVRTS